MPISTPSALGAVYDLTNANNTVLPAAGSVTLVAGQLYILRYGCDRNLGAPDLTTGYTITHGATDKTSSWTLIGASPTFGASGTSRQMVALWYIPPSTEAGITITFDPAGGLNLNNMVELIEVASGFNAAAPVKQFAYALTSGAASGSVALAGSPDADSICLSFWHTYLVTAGAVIARSGWTELSNITGSGVATDSGALESQYDLAPSPEQTASCSTAGSNRDWMGLILEIDAASTAFTPSITNVGVGAQVASNTGNLAPAWPVGYTPVAGHYALLFIAGWSTDAGGTHPAAPAGWNLVAQGGSTGPPFVNNEIFQRFLQAGDSAPTVVLPADWINVAGGGSAHIEVYAGVDTATPEDVGNTSGGLAAGTTGTPTTRTSVTDHALHIVFMASGDDNALSLSTPNGFTDRASGASYQTTLGADHATAVADLDKSPAGLPTAPIFTQTANGADLWAFIALALRPARAQVSGTVTIAITEADVLAGSKTIIITLGSGLQWIPA